MRLRVNSRARVTQYIRVDAEEKPVRYWRHRNGQWEMRDRIGEPWVPLRWTQVPPDVRAKYAEAMVG